MKGVGLYLAFPALQDNFHLVQQTGALPVHQEHFLAADGPLVCLVPLC